MYLHVNSAGFRHIITDTFAGVLKAISKDGNYFFSILNVGRPGKYDLIVTRETEKISNKTYMKAKIVLNPNNSYSYSYSHLYLTDYFKKYIQDKTIVDMFRANDEKSFDVISLFPEKMVFNGYLAWDVDIPESILDNFDELMEMLDTFFKQ